MITAVILVALFMLVQDTATAGQTVATVRNLTRWPGGCDAVNDVSSRIGTALTAGAYVAHGLASWQTIALLAATAGTSYFTTNRATVLAHRILPKGTHD